MLTKGLSRWHSTLNTQLGVSPTSRQVSILTDLNTFPHTQNDGTNCCFTSSVTQTVCTLMF